MQPIDILLIEDNEGDILLTREALQGLKIINKIHSVKDGIEAIIYLLKKENYKDALPPHLIPLDINLPKLNGQEVLKLIKSQESLRNIPVVSTSPTNEDISESIDNLATGYNSKPIDVKKFLKEIASVKELGFTQNQTINS